MRRVARRLSLRYRFQRLTSHEQVELRKIRKYAVFVVMLKHISTPDTLDVEEMDAIDTCLKTLILEYFSILLLDPVQNIRLLTSRRDRDIISFCVSDCPLIFRFQREHLRLLLDLLKFPSIITLDNRSKMSGEEVLLRGLFELVSGENKHAIAVSTFGRDWSQQSRAFKWFILHIYQNFKHLLEDNLLWWYRNGFFELSRRAIFSKMRKVEPTLEHNDPFNISHFIDCNCLSCSTPGGGPNGEGVDAPRHDDLIQRCAYNGWKSIHGLKHQTVDNALGMTVDMYGPTMLRRNDLALLRDSHINNRFRRLQVDSPTQYVIFGDSAYVRQSHILSYFPSATMPAASKCNYAIKTTRMSIEWNYGCTANLFKYFLMFNKLRLMESSTASRVYTVGTLLRNFLIALYGGQTSNYFNLGVKDPELFLRSYINSDDLDVFANFTFI